MKETEPAHPIADMFRLSRPSDSAVVLGKGPSLDEYEPKPNDFVLGINEVPLVQRCDVVLFTDSPCDDLVFVDQTIVVRPWELRYSHGGCGFCFAYKRAPYNPLPEDNPAYEIPWMGQGSLTMAVIILGMWGFRRLDFWGCDGFVSDQPADLEYSARIRAALDTEHVPVTPVSDCAHSARRVSVIRTGKPNAMIYKTRRIYTLRALDLYNIQLSVKGICQPNP